MSRDRVRSSLSAAMLTLVALPAVAGDETDLVLPDGAGRAQVQAACSMCHSLDYIVINSPFMDRTAWTRSVRKMVDVMGAPLAEADIEAIVDYLDRHYGVSPAPPESR